MLLLSHRREKGLPQKEAARLAKIDASTLSRLEAGERGVSREVLDRLCDVLDLDHQQRLDVHAAAGILAPEAARLLADEDLSRLAALLTDPETIAADRELLRQYVALALAHARALGYEVP